MWHAPHHTRYGRHTTHNQSRIHLGVLVRDLLEVVHGGADVVRAHEERVVLLGTRKRKMGQGRRGEPCVRAWPERGSLLGRQDKRRKRPVPPSTMPYRYVLAVLFIAVERPINFGEVTPQEARGSLCIRYLDTTIAPPHQKKRGRRQMTHIVPDLRCTHITHTPATILLIVVVCANTRKYSGSPPRRGHQATRAWPRVRAWSRPRATSWFRRGRRRQTGRAGRRSVLRRKHDRAGWWWADGVTWQTGATTYTVQRNSYRL